MFDVPLSHFTRNRPAVMVVSHARSGTHFLMNTLAACYEYVSKPWIPLDPQFLGAGCYNPGDVCQLLRYLAAEPLSNVVKSHHPAEFFAEELARVTERYVVFYIHRNPVDVMLSCLRFMHLFPDWNEGPKVADPLTFAREPGGDMTRYDPRPYPNMMARWADHVDGWLAAARANPRVVVVRYETLDTAYKDGPQLFQGARQAAERAQPPAAWVERGARWTR